MADYYRTGTTVTTVEDILDALVDFLTSSGPGPGWTEDASYLNSAHAGEMFIRTSGSTNMYLYFTASTVLSKTTLQGWWVPGTSNGYGGGTGPTNHITHQFCGVVLDNTNYVNTLHMFANEDRVVAILKSVLRPGIIVSNTQDTVFQVIYAGGYTSHADSADDTYPLLVASNGYSRLVEPSGAQWNTGSFPDTVVKKIGPGNITMAANDFRTFSSGQRVDTQVVRKAKDIDFKVPRNSRGGEAFAYEQELYISFPGAEESLSMTGLYITTPDVGLEQDVTIGVNTYYSFPQLVNCAPAFEYPGGPMLYGNIYLINKGTVTP